MPEYQIFALRYAGPLEGPGGLLLWLREWERKVQRNYYIWCLKGDGPTVVIDSGAAPATARQRELPGYESPAALLARLGVDAGQVEHLVLTHLHWDHCGGLGLFPSARVYVGREEYQFWQDDPLAQRGPFAALADPAALERLAGLQAAGRLELLEGRREILPGVQCVPAPGHSPGLMAVAAQTAQGTAVVGSDASHTFRNLREGWPAAIFCDMRACLESYDRLKALAARPELVFPGHDQALAEDYPQVAEGITKLV